jgi:hypothetical protein
MPASYDFGELEGVTSFARQGCVLSSIFADHLDDQNSIYFRYKDFHGGE